LLSSVLLVKTVLDLLLGGFVDDPQNVQTGNGTLILGLLPLTVVEILRNGNDLFGDCAPEILFLSLLHLLQNHGRNFLLLKNLLLSHIVDFDDGFFPIFALLDSERPQLYIGLHDGVGEIPTNQTLLVEYSVFRVPLLLVLLLVTDQPLRFGELDVRGGGPVTLVVLDNFDDVVLHNTNTTVGCA